MPPTEGQPRNITRADIPRILELEPALFGAESWNRGMYREELGLADRAYRGIDVDDRLVAYGGVLIAETAQVLTIGVDPDHRRRGLGSRLLSDLVAMAMGAGAGEVVLEVRSSDLGAQRLYERHGFVAIARRRNYYQRIGEDALVMRLTLP